MKLPNRPYLRGFPSVLFFVMYSVAFGYGYDRAMQGRRKPFAREQPR